MNSFGHQKKKVLSIQFSSSVTQGKALDFLFLISKVKEGLWIQSLLSV